MLLFAGVLVLLLFLFLLLPPPPLLLLAVDVAIVLFFCLLFILLLGFFVVSFFSIIKNCTLCLALQMLGERLFPLIQTMYPDLAGKIIGMLLEIDNKELLRLLESEESLKVMVEEAVAVLQAHQAKEQAAVTVKKEAATRVSSGAVRKGPVSTVGYEPLTDDMLAAAPPQEQKQVRWLEELIRVH